METEQAELQKILESNIDKELLALSNPLPLVFYTELFRLNGWDFRVEGIKKRPTVIGTWTNKLVYEQVKDVFEVIRNNKKSVSSDIGRTILNDHIQRVIGLLHVSDNMADMWCMFEKSIARQGREVESPYRFDANGETIEPIEESTLSEFSKNMLKTLNFDMKKYKAEKNTK